MFKSLFLSLISASSYTESWPDYYPTPREACLTAKMKRTSWSASLDLFRHPTVKLHEYSPFFSPFLTAFSISVGLLTQYQLSCYLTLRNASNPKKTCQEVSASGSSLFASSSTTGTLTSSSPGFSLFADFCTSMHTQLSVSASQAPPMKSMTAVSAVLSFFPSRH